jgi:hypothetical protein
MTNKTKVLKKKCVLLGLLLVLLLLVLALSLFYVYSSFMKNPETIKKIKSGLLADCATRSSGLKDECVDKVAELYRDYTLCGNISYTHLREGCYRRIAAALGNTSVCDFITTDEVTNQYCYMEIIIPTKNPELCEKINSSDQKDGCYKGIANLLNDPNLCDKIGNQFDRAICIENLALKTENPSICKKLEKMDRTYCIIHLAEKTRNSSLCENSSEDFNEVNHCYKTLKDYLNP